METTTQQNEDWAAIFGACPTHWPWWVEIEFLGGDWDKPSYVFLTVDDPDYEMSVVSKTLAPEDIFKALSQATEQFPHLFERIDGELDLDADSSDIVLQLAVLGEVVYG